MIQGLKNISRNLSQIVEQIHHGEITQTRLLTLLEETLVEIDGILIEGGDSDNTII